jgi:hypothetical protein
LGKLVGYQAVRVFSLFDVQLLSSSGVSNRSGQRSREEISCRKISVTRKRTVEICAAHPSLKESEEWGTLDLGKLKAIDKGEPPANPIGDASQYHILMIPKPKDKK